MHVTFSLLTALAATVSGVRILEVAEPVHPFEIYLSHENHTVVGIAITNTHSKAYNIFREGSLLDVAPVRKLQVSGSSVDPAFYGITKERADFFTGTSSQDDYVPIAAGQTLYQDVDLAEFHNLEDDTYDVSTAGYLPYAEGGSRALCGSSHSYTSNTLSIPVEGARARQVTKAIDRLEIKRTTIQSDCSSQQSSSITAANQECVTMANNAASAATSGSGSLFETYFGSSSTSTRQTVADNFQKIAQECSSTPGGNSESHCTDPYGSCGGTLLAYTIWRDGGGFGQSASRQGTLYYCPRYFDVLAAAPAQCQQQSQATNTLHETSHAVLATEDLAYGFSGVTRLSTEQAVVNADTYALYANDVALQCGSDGSGGTSGSSSGFSFPSGGSSGTSGLSTGGSSDNSQGTSDFSWPSSTSSSSGSSWNDLFNSWRSRINGA